MMADTKLESVAILSYFDASINPPKQLVDIASETFSALLEIAVAYPIGNYRCLPYSK